MSFALEAQPPVDPIKKRVAGVFTVLIISMTGLAVLSFFSRVHTTVDYGSAWMTAYAVTLIALFASTGVSLHRRRARIVGAGMMKKTGYIVAGFFGFAVLTAFGVFGGIPIVLHHLTSKDGRIVVTVTSKEDWYRKNKCRPRLMIKEFTFLVSDHICLGERAFAEIAPGSKITLQGNVSPFGISVNQISWVRKQQP